MSYLDGFAEGSSAVRPRVTHNLGCREVAVLNGCLSLAFTTPGSRQDKHPPSTRKHYPKEGQLHQIHQPGEMGLCWQCCWGACCATWRWIRCCRGERQQGSGHLFPFQHKGNAWRAPEMHCSSVPNRWLVPNALQDARKPPRTELSLPSVPVSRGGIQQLSRSPLTLRGEPHYGMQRKRGFGIAWGLWDA